MSSLLPSAKFWLAGMAVELNCFCLYHLNSFAADSNMLRTPKPNIMRDFFLTKQYYFCANPFSVYYCQHVRDTLICSGIAWAMIATRQVFSHVGVGHVMACHFLGGMVGGTTWIYTTQIAEERTVNTRYDVSATCSAGFSALCTMFMVTAPRAKVLPMGWPLAAFTVPYLVYAFYSEHGHRWDKAGFGWSNKKHAILHDGGVFGGMVTGVVYGLFLASRRKDTKMVNLFFKNMPSSK